jgi:predicted metal-binding membrane protein
MIEAADHTLDHLPPAAHWLGTAVARPRLLAVVCVAVLTALGWIYLGLMIAGTNGPAGALGPGMAVFDLAPRAWAAICRAAFGAGPIDAADAAVIALMWCAMTLAMMLPSAAPMILTYAEIADTAARKAEPVVTPLMLAAGYTAVWFGFAAVATAAQIALVRLALLDAGMTSASGLFSGAIFIAAGLYQFSALKLACLNKCRQPFLFFFTNWATTARGVLRLGVKQGLFCLGCCWAMMLVMFAVGVMNVIWMAGLGALMTAEKLAAGKRLTQGIGIAMIAIGVGFVFTAFAAHWPGHAI